MPLYPTFFCGLYKDSAWHKLDYDILRWKFMLGIPKQKRAKQNLEVGCLSTN